MTITNFGYDQDGSFLYYLFFYYVLYALCSTYKWFEVWTLNALMMIKRWLIWCLFVITHVMHSKKVFFLRFKKIEKKNKQNNNWLTTTFSLVTSRNMFSSVSYRLYVFLTLLISVISVMSVLRSVRSFILLIFVISVTSSIIIVSRGVSTIFSTKSVWDRSLTIFHVFVLASNICKKK